MERHSLYVFRYDVRVRTLGAAARVRAYGEVVRARRKIFDNVGARARVPELNRLRQARGRRAIRDAVASETRAYEVQIRPCNGVFAAAISRYSG